MNLRFFESIQGSAFARGAHAAWIFALLAACEGDSTTPEADLLDPDDIHGKSYGEWAANWVQYIYTMAPPECRDPIKDTTGADCAAGQDPKSPVFFLVGTYGGPVARGECVVPSEKALFFPLVNAWGDNAGLTPEEMLSDAAIKSQIEAVLPAIDPDSLYLRVDGQAIERLERTLMDGAVPYRLTLPEEPNAYTCLGSEGVVGVFDGYVTGAWAMLPPLPPGKHRIEFGGVVRGTGPAEADITVDTRYDLIVE